MELWRRNVDELTSRAICIFIFIATLSSLPPHHSLVPGRLLLGTADWMCVMSTEFNGELLKVFSKSFVFTKLLFVDHGNAEQLWPVAGPLLAARWNWSIVLSFKQSQDKYHHYSGRAREIVNNAEIRNADWLCHKSGLSAHSASSTNYCLLWFQVNILWREACSEWKI